MSAATEQETTTATTSNWKRVGLKGYKEYPKLSDETTAYSTDITLDGKVIGNAENDGKGGCDRISISPLYRSEWFGVTQEYAKETGEDFEPEDALIGHLTEMQKEVKEAKKIFKKNPMVHTVVAINCNPMKMGEKIIWGAVDIVSFKVMEDEALINAALNKDYHAA